MSNLDREDRIEKQYKRLRTRTPRCVACSEPNPFCLELHHLAGCKHHGDVTIVCRNCHRKLTDAQIDHGSTSPTGSTGTLATIGHYLLGLCDLFVLLVNTLREFGKWLVEASSQEQPA